MNMVERFTQPALREFPRRFNVAPGQMATVITPDGVREMRWGMLAPWRGHGGVRPPPIRIARADAIASTPVLAKAKRCVVVGDGWYARQRVGKNIHAWWLQSSAEGFAGLWTTHADDGVPSFAVIVQPSTGRSDLLPCGATADLTWREIEISRYFEDEAHDDAQCIAPLGNPNQGSLF